MVKEVNIDLFYNHSNQKYIFVSEEKVWHSGRNLQKIYKK